MDIIDYYISEEADHIPSLVEFLQNRNELSNNEISSNIFNFVVSFVLSEVVVQDVTGSFSVSESVRDLTISPDRLLNFVQ